MILESPSIDDRTVRSAFNGTASAGVVVQLVVDGAVVDARCDVDRAEATAGGQLTAVLPDRFCDGVPHVVSFRLRDLDRVSGSDSVIVACPDYSFELDALLPDRIDATAFRRNPQRAITLELWCNGTKIETATGDHVVAPSVSAPDRFEFPIRRGLLSNGALLEFIDAGTRLRVATVDVENEFLNRSRLARQARSVAPADAMPAALRRQSVAMPATLAASGRLLQHLRSSGWDRRSEAGVVDIVVPVYNALAQARRCIDSVLAARNILESRLVIVDDGSSDDAVRGYLHELEQRLPASHLLVIRNRVNRGFTTAVNTGMALSARDVVLLNSDTEVYDQWLDRLYVAAKSEPGIATVTPLSNNAEICSFPRLFEAHPIGSRELGALLSSAAAQANAGKTVELPVAIGFCMFVARQCLNEIGLFDAGLWGRGYGEEVDFCLKAAALGWRHLAACDVYVAHAGGVSFGAERAARISRSGERIAQMYGFYESIISNFVDNDPLRPARRQLSLELLFSRHARFEMRLFSMQAARKHHGSLQTWGRAPRTSGCARLVVIVDHDGAATLNIFPAEPTANAIFGEIHVELFRPCEIDQLLCHLDAIQLAELRLDIRETMPAGLVDWLDNRKSSAASRRPSAD